MVDVNVLVHAHRPEMPEHAAIREWFDHHTLDGPPFGMSDMVLSGFVRVATNRRIYKAPTPISVALDICDAILKVPNCIVVTPGANHWSIFDRLCRATGASGPLVPDAYLAALAKESGCERVTADGDFSRFPGLTWRHPLRGSAITNPG